MATFISTRVAPSQTSTGRQNPSQGWLGRVIKDVASILISANPAAADVYQMLRIPKGAMIIGGVLRCGSLVTAGTSTGPDIDVGWASNTSALLNAGAWAAAAVAGIKPEVGYYMPLGGLLYTQSSTSGGPQTMDIERIIQLTVNTSMASANFLSAVATLEVDYVPGVAAP